MNPESQSDDTVSTVGFSQLSKPARDGMRYRFLTALSTEDVDRLETLEAFIIKSKPERLSRNAVFRAMLQVQKPTADLLLAYDRIVASEGRRGRKRKLW